MKTVIDINPHDIEEKIKRFKKLFIPAVVIIALVAFIATGLYTVDASEEALVLRFGKFIKKTKPGLHFKIPFGIDEAIPIPVTRVFKSEFGFRTKTAGVRTEYYQGDFTDESLMLTGDLSIAEVQWIVQYKIADPEKFIFKVRNADGTLSDLSEAVTRRVIGDRTINEVLTFGRAEIEKVVHEELQLILDEYQTGLQIVTVKLQDVNAPDPVKPSFNEVNAAEQDKDRFVEQAWSEYNKLIPEARGKAEKTIAEAEGYALRRINRAKGDAQRFIEVYDEYRKAKDVTRRRLYLETLKEILPQVEEIYVVDEDQKSLLPLLDLSRKSK